MKLKQFILFTLILVAAGENTPAATITVRKDGFGDFEQVQSALDVAASGDTILIGPGEYTELIPSFIPGYGNDVDVCAYVRVPNLTIIGAGMGQTVLGPDTYLGTNQGFTPKCLVWLEGGELYISGITFRNCYDGIHAIDGNVYIENCEFLDNGGSSIIWLTSGNGGYVRSSNFESSVFGNIGLAVLGTGSNIAIENCTFVGSTIYLTSVNNILFTGCDISNSPIGIQLAAGVRCVIENSSIDNCSVAGVLLSGVAPHCDIVNSQVGGDQAAVVLRDEATLIAVGSVFQGGSEGVFFFQNSGQAVVHDSHLFRNGTYTINCSQPAELGLVVHDFTQNYWGTTDPETIASWINDQNDDPNNFSIVQYLPTADGPVAVENKSWGNIKALFR